MVLSQITTLSTFAEVRHNFFFVIFLFLTTGNRTEKINILNKHSPEQRKQSKHSPWLSHNQWEYSWQIWKESRTRRGFISFPRPPTTTNMATLLFLIKRLEPTCGGNKELKEWCVTKLEVRTVTWCYLVHCMDTWISHENTDAVNNMNIVVLQYVTKML